MHVRHHFPNPKPHLHGKTVCRSSRGGPLAIEPQHSLRWLRTLRWGNPRHRSDARCSNVTGSALGKWAFRSTGSRPLSADPTSRRDRRAREGVDVLEALSDAVYSGEDWGPGEKCTCRAMAKCSANLTVYRLKQRSVIISALWVHGAGEV